MKKFKRIVLSALAVVMLVGVMATPASAVTGSANFPETMYGYSFVGRLSATDTSAYATLEGTRIPGEVITAIEVQILGTIWYKDSGNRDLSKDFNSPFVYGTYVEVSGSITNGTSRTVTALYKANGTDLRTLIIGEIKN